MPEIEQDGSLPSTKTWDFFRQRLFAGDVDVDLAGVGVGAVFPEEDALPGAEYH
jgi:hypothetical protein